MNNEEQINSIRRKLAIWTIPTVLSITIPGHALTSIAPAPSQNSETDEPPVGDPPETDEGDCKGKKVAICHHPRNGNNQDICIGKPAVPAHLRLHGDTIGRCPE